MYASLHDYGNRVWHCLADNPDLPFCSAVEAAQLAGPFGLLEKKTDFQSAPQPNIGCMWWGCFALGSPSVLPYPLSECWIPPPDQFIPLTTHLRCIVGEPAGVWPGRHAFALLVLGPAAVCPWKAPMNQCGEVALIMALDDSKKGWQFFPDQNIHPIQRRKFCW